MKELRDLTDLTIHDVQPTHDEQTTGRRHSLLRGEDSNLYGTESYIPEVTRLGREALTWPTAPMPETAPIPPPEGVPAAKNPAALEPLAFTLEPLPFPRVSGLVFRFSEDAEPLSSECGTGKTVKARFSLWLQGKSPFEPFDAPRATGWNPPATPAAPEIAHERVYSRISRCVGRTGMHQASPEIGPPLYNPRLNQAG